MKYFRSEWILIVGAIAAVAGLAGVVISLIALKH